MTVFGEYRRRRLYEWRLHRALSRLAREDAATRLGKPTGKPRGSRALIHYIRSSVQWTLAIALTAPCAHALHKGIGSGVVLLMGLVYWWWASDPIHAERARRLQG